MEMRAKVLFMTSAFVRVAFSATCLVIFSSRGWADSHWSAYRDTQGGYAISYPPGWTLDPHHDYQALGPGKDIRGVAFVIPARFATGTNLADDSYLAVETLPDAKRCTADQFLDDADQAAPRTLKDNGMVWSFARGSDAGAGNFTEETVFAAAGTQPCIAVRYFIHFMNIANYDPGTMKPFDRGRLLAAFDKIRRGFSISPP